MPSRWETMALSQQKRSLRLRAASDAFEVLRGVASPRINHAELLKHAVRSEHEPHPRVVREVHLGLLEVREARAKNRPSVLKKISGVFSRKPEPMSIDDVIQRFEQWFVRPD